MSREYCKVCGRALKGCICKYVVPTSNQNHVTILRHFSEAKSIKGTALLLSLSLSNITLLDGEEFNKKDVIKDGMDNYLLFPSENARSISDELYPSEYSSTRKKNFIFLDGTWKKAYKILQVNPYLEEINHILLEVHDNSPYSQIRKQKSGGVSTLEAVLLALKTYEDEGKFTALESSFENFVEDLKKTIL